LLKELMQTGMGLAKDALTVAAQNATERHYTAAIAEMREELLQTVTGEAPPTWVANCRAAGVALDNETLQKFWSIFVRSLADQPATEASAS
jgi:hypothetical protein